MTTQPRVAVIVVTWNSAGVVADLLTSLHAGMRGLDWDLVVADNDSADGTVDVVRSLAPAAQIVETGRNAGYAAGINAALRRVETASAVLILNPDVRLRPGAGIELVRGLSEPRAGIVVPVQLDAQGRVLPTLRRDPTLLRAWGEAVLGGDVAGRNPLLGEVVHDPAAYASAGWHDWASGSVMLVSRECLTATGPWDESLFLYSEETDFVLRAREAGFRLLLRPEARAVHLQGESHASPALWRILILNKVRFYARRHNRAATAGFWLALVTGEGLRAVAGRATSRAAFAGLLLAGRGSRGGP
ncbi:MAG TPA: glycosyltransferase family 2 protein [Nocardioidaceae bacterium]|nr:glycosyltransferase family 2 protein [Nocardioidaceae bacterium]